MFTTSKKIQLDAPCIGEIEKKYLNLAIDSGFVSSVGPCIAEFEKKLADYVGVGHAVAVQNGTAALYMALYACGIGRGDEVIVPALTFAASVNPVLYVGATPVIVDVDLRTWTIDPDQVEKAITPKTKAIIPVHLYGNPCHMEQISEIAKKHSLTVIEDATESLGATWGGKQTGSLSKFGCFSFNGNKLITTGGGGMLISQDAAQIKRVRSLVNQAKDDVRPGFHPELGFNLRMTNIEAALGLAQWEQLQSFLDKKREFNQIYKDALAGIKGVSFQETTTNAVESAWLTCIKVEGRPVSDVITALQKKEIPTRRLFVPVNQMPYLEQHGGSCGNARVLYEQGLCLPSSVMNDPNDIKEVASAIAGELR